MRERDRSRLRHWLLFLCLVVSTANVIAAAALDRARISAPADDAAKAAIFELIDAVVARRDLSDLELLERTLRTDRKGSGFMVADRLGYILLRRADSALSDNASVMWHTRPSFASVQQRLTVSLDPTRICITLDDLSARYGEGIRGRSATHPPVRQDHPFHNVAYRFNRTVLVGIVFIYQTCANDFSVSVYKDTDKKE